MKYSLITVSALIVAVQAIPQQYGAPYPPPAAQSTSSPAAPNAGGTCTGEAAHCTGGDNTNRVLRCTGGVWVEVNCNKETREPVFGAQCVETSPEAGDASCRPMPPPPSGAPGTDVTGPVGTGEGEGEGESGNEGGETAIPAPTATVEASAIPIDTAPPTETGAVTEPGNPGSDDGAPPAEETPAAGAGGAAEQSPAPEAPASGAEETSAEVIAAPAPTGTAAAGEESGASETQPPVPIATGAASTRSIGLTAVLGAVAAFMFAASIY